MLRRAVQLLRWNTGNDLEKAGMVMENIRPVLEIAHVVPDDVGNIMEIAHVGTWVLMVLSVVVGNSTGASAAVKVKNTAAVSMYSFSEIRHFLGETFGKVVNVDDFSLIFGDF